MVAPAAPSARLRLQAPVPTPVALRQQALARAAVVQPRASVAPPGGQRAVEADEDAEEADLEELTYQLSAEQLAPEVETAFRRGPGSLPAVTFCSNLGIFVCPCVIVRISRPLSP